MADALPTIFIFSSFVDEAAETDSDHSEYDMFDEWFVDELELSAGSRRKFREKSPALVRPRVCGLASKAAGLV